MQKSLDLGDYFLYAIYINKQAKYIPSSSNIGCCIFRTLSKKLFGFAQNQQHFFVVPLSIPTQKNVAISSYFIYNQSIIHYNFQNAKYIPFSTIVDFFTF